MGLKADFDEVLDVWRSAPWRVRIWLGLSLFLASGSIASIAETVAKWKSFFLDSLNFYREYISIPIHNLLSVVFHFELPRGVSDALLLLGLLLSANIRVAFYRGGSDNSKAAAVGVSVGALVLVAGLFIWKGKAISANALVAALVTMVLYATLRFIKIGGATRLLWFVYLLTPLALVGLAAAVNSGLSK